MQVNSFKQGVPNWADLMTTDDAAAVAFYDELFGWTDVPQPISDGETYHMQQLEGDDVGAIGKQRPDEAGRGIPPHWNVYFAVDSLEDAVAKVTPAGGQVIAPPMDVMELGRMAVVMDPTGALAQLWEAKTYAGFDRVEEPGAVGWVELITDDPAKATAFYEAVLGVNPSTEDMGAGPYTLLGVDGKMVAGIMRKTPEMGQMPNVWGIYLEVDDADAALARAQTLGGTLLSGPTDIPPGRFAVLQDPQGAVFTVIKSSPMQG